MSQRAPGYRFQYQVPPTSPASSNAMAENPSSRSRYSMYRPENPAPTTATSTSAGTAADPFPDVAIRCPPAALQQAAGICLVFTIDPVAASRPDLPLQRDRPE